MAAGAAVLLSGVLALLQYRWTGELAVAHGERLRSSVQSSLVILGREFDSYFSDGLRALQPSPSELDSIGRDQAYAERYTRWRANSPHEQIFRRVALAVPQPDAAPQPEVQLRTLDADSGRFIPTPWPKAWENLRQQMEARLAGPGGPPPSDPHLIEIPRFDRRSAREQEWLIVEPDLRYVRQTLLPQLIERHLGPMNLGNFDVQVARKGDERQVLLGGPGPSARPPDGTVDLHLSRGPGRGRGAWQMQVWSRNDALASLVERNRVRNLTISGAVLLLLLFTLGLSVMLAHRMRNLAEMQMNFVAGVSHELRTPLTVIRTAAFNLRGRTARNPAAVERYGELIGGESTRLERMVEEVLQFATARAGHLIRSHEAIDVQQLLSEVLRSVEPTVSSSGGEIAASVPPGLLNIQGDEAALRHALQNLIENAAKYALNGNKRIDVRAEAANRVVRIHVRDHGPGIPAEEQARIFEPFYRGRRAVSDQIRGTGLGLHLVKRIAEAHGGRVLLKSTEGEGAEFTLELPAASQT